MRIGILTFHSQLNYGGVLQCWALQTALEKLGHEVVVMDRWQDDNNYSLERGYNKYGIKQWIKFAIRASLGLGDINLWLRVRRTKRFLKQYIKRTQYHFVDWSAAPKDLGVDMLVVGSDQVWHCGDWGDSRAYLLDGAPNIPAIAYAASFGMTELPPEYIDQYKRGLSRFNAISCREKEGVDICRNLGFDAAHVVDPTQLLHPTDWLEGLDLSMHVGCKNKRVLLCYMLSEDVIDILPHLVAFAKQENCTVKILLNSVFALPFPKNNVCLRRYVAGLFARWSSRIKIMDSVGPRQFVEAFANADWVLSDSFHALMFSVMFGCNVRILAPKSGFRAKMFARMEEFATHMKGKLVANSTVEALASFVRGETVTVDAAWLDCRRQDSHNFLKEKCA